MGTEINAIIPNSVFEISDDDEYPVIKDSDIWKESKLKTDTDGNILLYDDEGFRTRLWNYNVDVKTIADSLRLQNICEGLRNCYFGEFGKYISKKECFIKIVAYVLLHACPGENLILDDFSFFIPGDFYTGTIQYRSDIAILFLHMYAKYSIENFYIVNDDEDDRDSFYAWGDFVNTWEVLMLRSLSIHPSFTVTAVTNGVQITVERNTCSCPHDDYDNDEQYEEAS